MTFQFEFTKVTVGYLLRPWPKHSSPSTPELFFLQFKKENYRKKKKKKKRLLCFPTDPLVPPWGPPRGFPFEIHDSLTSPRGRLTLVPLFKEGKWERKIINNSVCWNSFALPARLLGFSESCDCSGTATWRDLFCFLPVAATEKKNISKKNKWTPPV